MELDIITLLLPNNGKQRTTEVQQLAYPVKKFDTVLYARNKSGSIRSYQIIVREYQDKAVLFTIKNSVLGGKDTVDSYVYTRGVNIGKSNETTYTEQAVSEAKSLYRSLLDGGFSEKIPTCDFNTDANGIIKPMLAISFDSGKIRYPCIVQPKYDGLRLLMVNVGGEAKLLSRRGKELNVPHLKKWAQEHMGLLPLDGELYNHHELSFQEICSAAKRYSEMTDKLKYVVYDKPCEGTNSERWSRVVSELTPVTNMEKDTPVFASGFSIANSLEEVKKLHDKYVGQGYEGAIIRNTDAKYEFGFRSSNLIKLKQFQDDEFEIVSILEASGRDRGTAVFLLKTKEGKFFQAKPQGPRELRRRYLLDFANVAGKMCTVQYQGLSDDGVPRFPSAVAVRDYE